MIDHLFGAHALQGVQFPVVKAGSKIRAVSTLENIEFVSPERILMTIDITAQIESEVKPTLVAESLAQWVLNQKVKSSGWT